jgi:hypothetical protein
MPSTTPDQRPPAVPSGASMSTRQALFIRHEMTWQDPI